LWCVVVNYDPTNKLGDIVKSSEYNPNQIYTSGNTIKANITRPVTIGETYSFIPCTFWQGDLLIKARLDKSPQFSLESQINVNSNSRSNS